MQKSPAYELGFTAFQHSETTNSCFYPAGSNMGREWLEGWTASQVAERETAQGASASQK